MRKLTTQQVTRWKEELFVERNLRIPTDQLQRWPLDHYLWAAVFQAKDLFDGRELDEQIWQTPAWDFGRFAKAHPKLMKLDENAALKLVKATIGSRFWETHFEMDVVDAEMAFDDIWVKCRAVPGYDPLTLAVMNGKRAALDKRDEGPSGYQVFLCIAQSLSAQLRGEAFMLPCHKLAPMLDCTPITISRYRQKAIREGQLRIVKEHSFRSKQKGEATEFLWADGRE